MVAKRKSPPRCGHTGRAECIGSGTDHAVAMLANRDDSDHPEKEELPPPDRSEELIEMEAREAMREHQRRELVRKIPDLVEGLREEVHALREEVQALRRKEAPEGPEALLTREEAAERLSISTRTLDDMADRGEIQPVRIRGRVLYSPDTLDAYIRRKARGGGR